MIEQEAIYERWENGERVEIKVPKKLKVRRLTKEEVQEIKDLIEQWAVARNQDRES